MNSEETQPPKSDKAEAEADDRTLLVPSPTAPGADDDDRTMIAAPPTNEVDPDRTMIAAPPTEDVDPDRTMIAAPPDSASLDDDRTMLAAPVPIAGNNPDGTVVSRPTTPPRPVTMTDTISTGPATQTPLRTLEIGNVINNMYRVEERIDHGGMGRVFRGIEIGTGESVAIKVILPEMAEDPRVAQMFRREARTLRQLHHDAIVRYFAYVPPDTNFNLHALVMGFIEGTKLSDRIKERGPLDEEQACEMFLRLAGGLERAHAIGIVHRDLSPDNVMLPDDDISKALLIDFGISRSSKIADGTLGNEFAGKLKYVSPEQLGAYGGEAGPPSDVYSLALLMIVSLTGQAMAMGDSIVDAVQKRQAVPDLTAVPERFQSLLYKMLQPDPGQRIASMAEVIAGLRGIAGGQQLTDLGPRPAPPTETRSVPGLQAAPGATLTGLPRPRQAQTVTPTAPAQSNGGFGKIVAAGLVLAGLGVGGWFVAGQPGVPTSTALPPQDGAPERIAGSPAAFLAEALDETPCTLVRLRAQGRNAGLLEGYAPVPSDLPDVPTQYASRFGMQPDMMTQTLTEPQCPAVDLTRNFQGTPAQPLEMSLASGGVSRSEGVVGTLHNISGRETWLALVTPGGGVFSLMSRLADPVGDVQQFSFRLPSAQPGRYLLLAVASDQALVRAGAMTDGTAATAILPLIDAELARGTGGSVDIGIVEITP
ncbi:protein kinase [Sulfitobacter albidus]|uniref:Protein kinase n=1 Tax=Sulfitobacter albidus TaxID=2829501 RepID=A0A975JGY9_9RHOB|nr:serine/threonine-protein kinase [Sulfitobacter albidus]QUJ78117.1 protein kinase [Sulfitobacter albidus]